MPSFGSENHGQGHCLIGSGDILPEDHSFSPTPSPILTSIRKELRDAFERRMRIPVTYESETVIVRGIDNVKRQPKVSAPLQISPPAPQASPLRIIPHTPPAEFSKSVNRTA